MTKRSREDFKSAFKAVKKPKPPSKAVGGDKAAIDKAIDKGDPDKTLSGLIDKLVASGERDYIVKLVAYKYAKHYEDGSAKRPQWAAGFPADIFTDALSIVVPDGIDSKLTQKTVDRAVASKSKESLLTCHLLHERNPKAMTEYVLGKCKEAEQSGDKGLILAWKQAIPPDSDSTALLFETIADTDDAEAAGAFAAGIPLIVDTSRSETVGTSIDRGAEQRVMDIPRIVGIAAKNPKLFAKEILPRLKDNSSVMLPLLGDADLRELLKREAPKEWAKLAEATPMLGLFDGVESRIKTKKLDTTAKVANELFDSIVNNKGIELSYYTNTLYTPNDLMLGPSDSQQKTINAQRSLNPEATPDGPATQCSMLTNTMQRMMEFCPGIKKKPKLSQGEVAGMAMTVPLSSIKSKGLLDKSFPGNVFDKNGAPTGRVLFTGDGGIKSHTWLIIDGVAYDSVLGTKGDAVEAAVAEEFKWAKPGQFAKGDGGSFIIQVTNDVPAKLKTKPKVAANKMGFATAYILTDDPASVLSTSELKEMTAVATEDA